MTNFRNFRFDSSNPEHNTKSKFLFIVKSKVFVVVFFLNRFIFIFVTQKKNGRCKNVGCMTKAHFRTKIRHTLFCLLNVFQHKQTSQSAHVKLKVMSYKARSSINKYKCVYQTLIPYRQTQDTVFLMAERQRPY